MECDKPIIGSFLSGTIGEVDAISRQHSLYITPMVINHDPVLAGSHPEFDTLSCGQIMARYYEQTGVWYVVGNHGPNDYYREMPFNQNG
jgi:hypothetical protein